MFKNILSTLNNNKNKDSSLAGANADSAAIAATRKMDQKTLSERNNNQKQNKLDSNNNNNNNNHNITYLIEPTATKNKDANKGDKNENQHRRMISRKSRKRLSAMMGRLNEKLTGQKANKLQVVGMAYDDTCDHYADDSDDEYISAEEMISRKNSFNKDQADNDLEPINENVEEIIKSRKLKSDDRLLLDNTTKLQLEKPEKQSNNNNKDILPEEECDIPTFLYTKNCDYHLIEETRRLLKERYVKNPDNFYDMDYKRMMSDDWTVSRFLLRRRQDPKRTAKLMEECGNFRKTYKMSEVQLFEFPMEFHKAGGLFKYAPDRVGNITLFMRVKMYRRVPEISDVFKAFILCVLELCDSENNGRGTAIVFDLSGCGLQNVDLGFLSWLLSSFRNYCPKGVSYILVYNLPWILNATCKLAMTWMSASNRRALRFAYGQEIENFIAKENLPDYCGGTCKINYREVPEGSRPAIEVCDIMDITPEQAMKIRELFKEYLTDEDDNKSNYDDAKSANSNCVDFSTQQQQQQQQQQHQHQRHDSHVPSQQESTPSLRYSNNDDGTTTTTTTPMAQVRTPVADLVSQASKFVAH